MMHVGERRAGLSNLVTILAQPKSGIPDGRARGGRRGRKCMPNHESYMGCTQLAQQSRARSLRLTDEEQSTQEARARRTGQERRRRTAREQRREREEIDEETQGWCH
jgi:hypothetical protein